MVLFNRAMVAKLQDPDMTLHQALIVGGFDFPEVEKNDKSSTYAIEDSTGTHLGQRKNQLSRRLREAKKKIELIMKREECGRSKTLSVPVRDRCDVASQCSANDDNSSIVHKKCKKCKNDFKSSLTDSSVRTNLNGLIKSLQKEDSHSHMSMSISSVASVSKINQKTTQKKAMKMSSGNPKATFFPGKISESDFSEKDCTDSFRIPTVSRHVDASSILHYSDQHIQNIKNTCDNMEGNVKDPTQAVLLETEFHASKKSDAEKKSSPNIHHRLRENDVKDSADFNENRSITSCSLASQNKPMVKKAIDIFDSDIHNFLLSIMRSAGYPASSIDVRSVEYLTLWSATVKSPKKRLENSRNSLSSCYYSDRSVPLKKRKYATGLSFLFKENILN